MLCVSELADTLTSFWSAVLVVVLYNGPNKKFYSEIFVGSDMNSAGNRSSGEGLGTEQEQVEGGILFSIFDFMLEVLLFAGIVFWVRRSCGLSVLNIAVEIVKRDRMYFFFLGCLMTQIATINVWWQHMGMDVTLEFAWLKEKNY